MKTSLVSAAKKTGLAASIGFILFGVSGVVIGEHGYELAANHVMTGFAGLSVWWSTRGN